VLVSGDRPLSASRDWPLPLPASGDRPLSASGERPLPVSGERPPLVSGERPLLVSGNSELLGEVFARLITAVRAVAGDGLVEADLDQDQWRVSLPLFGDSSADRLFTATNATALMFARAVIGRHGGSVGIEHSRLTVRLPAVTPSEPPPGSAVPAG
jgi:hypothetical protein